MIQNFYLCLHLYLYFLETQKKLGYEFEKILYENLWDLYEK